MARYHYWQYVVDEDGRPLEGVNIRIYLNDNPNTEADIFTHPYLGSPTKSSITDLESDGNGYFEFWVGDEFETLGGYSSTQKFRLTWQRAGILLGEIDNIDIFPPVFQVDETDNTSLTADQRNKLISNRLAYRWETHRTSTYVDQPHDIEPVDWTDTDTTYNKLVSNSLMNYVFSVLASAGTLSIDASGAIGRYYEVLTWTPSDDYFYVDLTHGIGREYPAVQVTETTDSTRVMPQRVQSLSSNSLRIWVSEQFDAEITIIG